MSKEYISKHIGTFGRKFETGPEYKANHKIDGVWRPMIEVWKEGQKPNITINLDVFARFIQDAKEEDKVREEKGELPRIYEKKEWISKPKPQQKKEEATKEELDISNMPF